MKNIYKDLELPNLFEKTEDSIWTDSHISKQLLQAHLDPLFEGATRPLSFVEESISWIEKTIPPPHYRKLVDIGCGPGIYAEYFSQAGYDVCGVDFSASSINYAKTSSFTKQLNIEYRHLDYLVFDDKQTFDFATMIYCDYGALSKDNRKRLLNNIYQALKPNSCFLLDVFSLQKLKKFKEFNVWNSYPQGGFWSNHSHFTIQQNKQFENEISLEHTLIIEKEKVRNIYLWSQYFTKELIMQELNEAGFEIIEVYSDITGKPYSNESETIAVLARK